MNPLDLSLFKDTQLGSGSGFLWILTGKHVLTVSATEIKRRSRAAGWLTDEAAKARAGSAAHFN